MSLASTDSRIHVPYMKLGSCVALPVGFADVALEQAPARHARTRTVRTRASIHALPCAAAFRLGSARDVGRALHHHEAGSAGADAVVHRTGDRSVSVARCRLE